MKTTMRLGVFETNSSSQHSLAVLGTGVRLDGMAIASEQYVKKENPDDPNDFRFGKWEPGDECFTIKMYDDEIEFGRSPFRVLSEPLDKFYYLVADKWGYSSPENKERDLFIQQMVDGIPGCIGFEFPWNWKRSWDADPDNDDVTRNVSYGCVDGQSAGIIWSYINEHEIDPFDFIYDTHYVIVVDGDEYCVWEKLKGARVIDIANIVEEYPGTY